MSPMQLTGTPARLNEHMKLLLAALFAIGFASVPFAQASACSCGGLGGPEVFAEAADAAFAGTVINTQPFGGPLGAVAAPAAERMPIGQTIYTFEVDGVAKGPIAATVDVLAGGDGASCGVTFGQDERWLVFTIWDGALHSTGLCSGNLPLEKGAEAPLPLTAPTASSPEPESPAVPSVILGLIGIVGVVIAVSWLAFRRGSTASPS